MVIFPQGTPGFVFEGEGTELANDDVLGGRLEGQRDHNALDIVPLLNDQLGVELAAGFEHHLVIVLARVLEAIKRGANRIIEVPVAGRELIAEQVQDGEIDRVSAMGVSRMHVGLDVTGIVEQDIEHIVAFMVVGANDLCIHGDVIGHQGIGDDAFFEPKVFG